MANSFKKILFIEDDVFISGLYTDVFQQNGFEVTCSLDGESGLEAARSQPCDIILLDLMLPGKPGIEVLTELRDPALSPSFDQSTPIFVFTNFEEDDETKHNLLSMAQAYLVKVNITPRTLSNILKALAAGQLTLPLPETFSFGELPAEESDLPHVQGPPEA